MVDQSELVITLDDLDNAPLSLNRTGQSLASGPPDYRSSFTEVADENARLKEEKNRLSGELSELQQKLKTKEILDGLLSPYAAKAYRFMCCYAGFVGAVLLMNGFGCFKIPITEAVMKFLVGSTAATVIGLVGMVLTGIFVGARK